jgi:hypothetical protein
MRSAGISVIEIPCLKPHNATFEIFMCEYRDGLGYLHKCLHPETKYLQCEMAIHCGGCPRGLKGAAK